ncbi:MAG: excinuclease ABC subunit UvrA [Ignavibacteriae bacterium]|nr:excinuclease ABC subunit UvrA [Ignavibacteria bacterium]MBI3365917.1 excinuclease ABC subunit UvrA [Ignavibacteriota bacterium]
MLTLYSSILQSIHIVSKVRTKKSNTVARAAAAEKIQKPTNGSRKSNIVIRGARVHNLKNISLELPRNKLIVFTGVSGSGKSSLAFDTIYAEGQRRFVESLSAYARQFLERMDKPDVDFIQGISPAIAIEQKTTARNPRSTVGTTTEIYDYLRLLYARIGKTYCHNCKQLVQRDSVRTVLDTLQAESEEHEAASGDGGGLKLYVLFPLHEHKDIPLKVELENLKREGFFRVFHNNEIIDLNERTLNSKTKKKDVLVLVDRLVYRKGEENTRMTDSIETAFKAGEGYAVVKLPDSGEEYRFNQHFECSNCGIRYEEPDPRLFSFNNPFGACPKCQGFGRAVGIDMDLVVPDKETSLRDGAIHPWISPKWHNWLRDLLRIAYDAKLRIDVPFKNLTKREIDIVMNGCDGFEGIHAFFTMIERKMYKIYYRILLSRYRGYTTCDACGGARLRPDALYVQVGGKNISDIVRMTIEEAHAFFDRLKLTQFEVDIARRILEELRRRLKYLDDVGIGYLTLDRLSNTLSGGESQRINLATALGSSLVGSLYVLDEPSIGLHPRDNQKLISILKSLRDVGNTVIVVEHDAEMMEHADQIVDMGPRAGEFGGEIIFQGDYASLLADMKSVTGRYLSGHESIPVPKKRRGMSKRKIVVRGAAEHNLKNIDVEIPLNMFVTITGVSGSGKSTLVHEVLYTALKQMKGMPGESAGKHRAIEGAEFIDDVELVDQSPIGRTPRSNPITYIKAFDIIRDLLASTQAAKIHGYLPGYFSFNVEGGRCEACEGSGIQTIEMQFLADLELTCEVCKGKRYKKEVLEIRYREKNVDDILGMTVTEAIEFFKAHPSGKRVAQRLQVLDDVGMGYIRLGQSATTLSGGEAQRIKLSSHLVNREKDKHTLFIFDEPTTGLHFDDIAKLLRAFNALIENGNSVLIIEHNMDVIKCADWMIDLGPEAGDKGGEIVAVGTPEEVVSSKPSYTGEFLKRHLS